MPHPANSPFTVEVADAHPQVDVSRRRTRSNAVLHTTMLFRSSSNSAVRVTTGGAERVRIAITGPEATAFGNPTFGERTSITITHRDVNHALRSSLYSRNPCQPVRFVTVAPIPEAEVLPPPNTPGINLPLTKPKEMTEGNSELEDDYSSLVPPDEVEVMEQYAQKVAKQRISDHVKSLLEEKEAMRAQTSLSINTSGSSDYVSFPCTSTSSSPTPSEYPERPSAPGPLSPYSDNDDDDFPLGIRRPDDGPGRPTCKSFGGSSVAESTTNDAPRVPELYLLKNSQLKNGSSSSLPQTAASPVTSLTQTLKLKLASSKSMSTSDLSLSGHEYSDGATLVRERIGNVATTSGLKQRFPVVKKLFGLGKSKAAAPARNDDGASDGQVTVPVTSTKVAKVKGQKRQRDDEEADENIPPPEEKEKRNIRRRLVA
ncbi:hypothetical protein L218DRAFT_1076092 [Marasmius fiardii PR-910]|nr:hypothetical protein L218DRAFT_1076092 [Marasmius fiardii PR-910]